MTYHDNDVYFSLAKGYSIIEGSYTVESYSVTDGQDPKGHIHTGLVVKCGGDGKFTFSVGRHGSGQVADWFNQHVPASQTTFNHTAGALNFAFLGTLKLTITGGMLGGAHETFTFQKVALAQGHAGSSNNWWFGGQKSQYIQHHQVLTDGQSSQGKPVSFTFLRGGNNVSTVGVSPATLVDTANWMGQLSDSTRIDEIMMPGSHDAGMSELHHCAPPYLADSKTKTQSGSIGQQLKDGSRYFDIRVDWDHGKLVTFHRTDGWGCNGQDLESIMNQAREFLMQHPKETAIFKFAQIRKYSGHDPENTMKEIVKLLGHYSSYLYANANSSVNLAQMDLGSVRGKLILVFNEDKDYPTRVDPAQGRFRYRDGSTPMPNLTVFDKYSDTTDYETMKRTQLEHWSNYGGLGQGFLFLLSWTLTPTLTSSGVATLAEKANSRLPDVLYDQIINHNASKPNVVYIDFLNSQITQGIIWYNFVKERTAQTQ
ncbi:hypothetical protein [Pontibacter sp. G13]|uniref:hypothetical protein n=1 Tax=Pontibacter sp. G13 TaxID=3074898 RepID=UPI002889F694|nr:hypothetical protein [Pontibacter sp. G13]WNJ20214.1 hypothetical protein RJD25_07015 [Pontibacter sp. G13]